MTDHLDLEIKIGEPSEDGTFEGFASIFNETDQVGDQIAPGAFRKSLAAHKRSGRLPLMLWSHDLATPIGRWTDIRETATGLVVKGKLLLDLARGREAYSMLKEKIVDGLSIGFRTVQSSRIKGGRLLTELDLAEISLVSLPALASARVHSVKSQDSTMSDHDDDGAVETAAAELPPEVLERIEAVETKAGAVADLAARLDRVETKLSRPSARIEVREDPQLETKAFTTWCRKGWDGCSDLEKKVLSATGDVASPSTDGWQLVPQVFLNELMKNLVEISPMRQVARVQTVSGSPVLLPKRTANLSASWVAELAQHALSDPTYTQQSIPIFEARVSTEVSNQLLEDAAFNLAAELSADFAEEFGRLEGAAFVNGDGTTMPEGFTVAADFVEDAGGAALDSDDIISLYYAVPSRYAANGTWLLRRETIADIRQFRSAADGPYVWADTIVPGQPPTLMGRPVVEMPDMVAAGGSPAHTVIAFGDWSRAYRIFDRVGLEILRDPYTLARNSVVTFHARKRVGGALVDGSAVRGLSQ